MRLVRMSILEGSVTIQAEHLSDDILWAIVKRGQPLPDAYIRHTKDCRDCREFVSEFSLEARSAGIQFPDLLPQSDLSRLHAMSNKRSNI